ncbi:MAG: bifunctional (p)ppGpp synthetase/guanosine-3',5'-bis(diphosphate) 3'-pyrophosphohydrolase [Prevotella sp.]|nr:bifunctional (p)ppGpp synthetase/guanosine-3',5'-bis(diphosphate) 3'-pyrophosphohydrolase [Prevotella sp.]MBQ8114718.1 bifunctional (p)ppGpp synthetase/guanosine-3',5'-bis(diphosphate) 3'-pyrophosphohydrolase [Prevotella sp.]
MKQHIDTSLLDRAITFAVKAHQGMERKGKGFPYVVHPMEAVCIVATMTNDQELLAAAALHDVIEDTDTTADDLKKEFGEHVAMLVEAESDDKTGGSKAETWHQRKQDTLDRLRNADLDIKIVALGDKLSNMRAIAHDYAVLGDELWNRFTVKDPAEHAWRYHALAEALNDLSDTDAYKEFHTLVNKTFGTLS